MTMIIDPELKTGNVAIAPRQSLSQGLSFSNPQFIVLQVNKSQIHPPI